MLRDGASAWTDAAEGKPLGRPDGAVARPDWAKTLPEWCSLVAGRDVAVSFVRLDAFVRPDAAVARPDWAKPLPEWCSLSSSFASAAPDCTLFNWARRLLIWDSLNFAICSSSSLSIGPFALEHVIQLFIPGIDFITVTLHGFHPFGLGVLGKRVVVLSQLFVFVGQILVVPSQIIIVFLHLRHLSLKLWQAPLPGLSFSLCHGRGNVWRNKSRRNVFFVAFPR